MASINGRRAVERRDAQHVGRTTELGRPESRILALQHSVGNRALARAIEQAPQVPPARRMLARVNVWKYLFDSRYRHRYNSHRADRRADEGRAEIDEVQQRIARERGLLDDPALQLASLHDRRPRPERAEAERRVESLEHTKDKLEQRHGELLDEMRNQARRDADRSDGEEIVRSPPSWPA